MKIKTAAEQVLGKYVEVQSEMMIGSKNGISVDITSKSAITLPDLNLLHIAVKKVTGDEHILMSIASYGDYKITITIV